MNGRIEELKQQAADYVDSIDNGIDIEEYRKLLDQKFADLIRADEREACAKVCEKQEDYGPLCETPYDCADAIRARGNT